MFSFIYLFSGFRLFIWGYYHHQNNQTNDFQWWRIVNAFNFQAIKKFYFSLAWFFRFRLIFAKRFSPFLSFKLLHLTCNIHININQFCLSSNETWSEYLYGQWNVFLFYHIHPCIHLILASSVEIAEIRYSNIKPNLNLNLVHSMVLWMVMMIILSYLNNPIDNLPSLIDWFDSHDDNQLFAVCAWCWSKVITILMSIVIIKYESIIIIIFKLQIEFMKIFTENQNFYLHLSLFVEHRFNMCDDQKKCQKNIFGRRTPSTKKKTRIMGTKRKPIQEQTKTKTIISTI